MVDYSFASKELSYLSAQYAPNSNYKTNFFFGSASGYNQVKTKVYAVDPNYLKVVNDEYYMPQEV